MLKLISIFLCLQIVFLPIIVKAEETSERITALKKGDPAPYDGSLLNPAAVAKILAEKEYQEKKCLLEKDYALSNLRAKCDLEINKCIVERDICQEKYTNIIKIKDDENKRLSDLLIKSEKQNSDQLWWIGGGVLVGIVTSVAIFFAVSYGQK